MVGPSGRQTGRRTRPRRVVSSIGFRVSATCWLVTLLTLALYVTVSLPQQKKDLRDALRSKAQGVSSSLQDITAGAALSADYSTVVDHCIQVLKGDDAIEYLVVTRQDGFSVIVQRSGWRTETLGEFWRPAERNVIGEIAYVPLAGRRVFRYARPFDYVGLHWGWLNVGLSTAAYDSAVTQVHQRSALLAVLGAGLSLLISFTQAKRLVKPIITLKGVVGQVAGGNLRARANLRSGDEVEDLAQSFNLMADTILDRNRILESVRFAGQQLLSADDWTAIVSDVLAKVGQSAGVSRAYLLENGKDTDGVLVSNQLFAWLAPGISSTETHWRNFRWGGSRLEDWAAHLTSGQVLVAGFPRHKAAFERIDPSLRSLVLAPIRMADGWWGLLGFDECAVHREWGEAEKDSFQAVADMFGAAIARQRAKQALVEANESLERRVLERTRELQEQVQAKEEANAQLAEAQQRLIDLSRQAGMAEVATGVLHNVGNVLNSVNVSATIVANKVRESRLSNLVAVSGMLEEHAANLPDFLNHDPKGQRLVPYLVKLGGHLEDERQVMLRELDLLTGHVGHIKEIVATQQSYAKVSGLIEVVSLADLVEDAVNIVRSGLDRRKTVLDRDFEPVPPVAVDKHAVLQILLNLLRNANQAMQDARQRAPRVRIRLRCRGNDWVRVSVTDNGVGLPAGNITRIFSHGFTTRRDGHGFGLHSGANAAKQMGGRLWAESGGPGLGATFTLELPINARARAKGNGMQPV